MIWHEACSLIAMKAIENGRFFHRHNRYRDPGRAILSAPVGSESF
jgi:hypothetical protein